MLPFGTVALIDSGRLHVVGEDEDMRTLLTVVVYIDGGAGRFEDVELAAAVSVWTVPDDGILGCEWLLPFCAFCARKTITIQSIRL